MSEWIKCKDRMPKEDGRYLITGHYWSMHIEILGLTKGKWDDDYAHAEYWMPLPETPNE